MRIIAGRLRRRKLLTNPGLTTRPIIDRAKVMLFDHIRDRLPNARVADFFCGTGTLGFEALSRGAQSVVFAERDHRAHELLVQNAAELGVSDEVLCWRVDVARSSLHPKGERWTPFNVVFFDPPYQLLSRMAAGDDLWRSLQRLQRPEITAPDVLLVVRADRYDEVSLPEGWVVDKTLTVASMQILLVHKEPDLPDASADGEPGS